MAYIQLSLYVSVSSWCVTLCLCSNPSPKTEPQLQEDYHLCARDEKHLNSARVNLHRGMRHDCAPYLAFVRVAVLLIISILLLTRARGRTSEAAVGQREGSFTWPSRRTPLALEVSARIFNPEDLNFVATETSGSFAHTFRKNGTTCSGLVVRHVRGQVRQLFGSPPYVRVTRISNHWMIPTLLRVPSVQ